MRTAGFAPFPSSPPSGISFVDPAALAKHVTELDALGFQVHFHALGDRAVREALDAVAAARSVNGFRDTGHHLAHLQVVHPDDVARFRVLGATATVQALWAAHERQMDELTCPSWARNGPPCSIRSVICSAPAPRSPPAATGRSAAPTRQALHVAVNRRAPDAPEGTPVFLPEQRVDLSAAIAAYTAGSAYANHLDDTGTVTPGKPADLVVVDRDPFEGPPEGIAATRVLHTFVGGVRVYAAPDA